MIARARVLARGRTATNRRRVDVSRRIRGIRRAEIAPRVLRGPRVIVLVAVFAVFGALRSHPHAQTPAESPGQALFAARCGFCHGRDAAGGETGPDLTTSPLVRDDVGGEKLVAVIRDGRINAGMPAFALSAADLDALVTFIRDQQKKAEAQPGRRRGVVLEDLQTGNPAAGKAYFDGAGGCARCHKPDGDLAGVATRLQPLALLRRMLFPTRGERPNPATVTVTLPSASSVTGRLVYRDEFTIALTDASGWYRSWPIDRVKVTVDDPLDAHRAQLGRYTDKDMHDVLAYLQTLR
jgi:cytochrome c oxidase cbb3-type subunit III